MKFSNSNSSLTESDIYKLEHILNKKLPDFYKKFLINYPDELLSLGAPYNTVSELSLPNTVDRLIEINEAELTSSNILIIGVNGMGDFYYIILNDDPIRIYEFPHEDPPFIENTENIIDWKKPFSYSNLNEFISELKETLKEKPLNEKQLDAKQKELNLLANFIVLTSIECEMRDELLVIRNLEIADNYPTPINILEIAKSFKVDNSLFIGYPHDDTITNSFLASVDKTGVIIKPDFLGGDNMRITDSIYKNIINLKFKPAIKNKELVNSHVLIRYRFTLQKK